MVKTFNLLSLQLSNIQHSIVNYSQHAVRDIPRKLMYSFKRRMSSLLKRKKKGNLLLEKLPIRAVVFNSESHARRWWSCWPADSSFSWPDSPGEAPSFSLISLFSQIFFYTSHFPLLMSPCPIPVCCYSSSLQLRKRQFYQDPQGQSGTLSPRCPGPGYLLNISKHNIKSQGAEGPRWAWCITLHLLPGNEM